MTLKVTITKGKYKGQKGRVVGVYMDGRRDVKLGRKYVVIAKGHCQYVD